MRVRVRMRSMIVDEDKGVDDEQGEGKEGERVDSTHMCENVNEIFGI